MVFKFYLPALLYLLGKHFSSTLQVHIVSLGLASERDEATKISRHMLSLARTWQK